ncbi:neuronal acetylcholine receptor subunit alpha-6-like [Ostrea edulis]|uniref:neuronal acetylcholine receptor subunit alpha-6-like n=1 Tax=Ostrea edulis TaxID=37623 RepID=UPI002094329C|nr:neuronal acetylcholine receptor subunit alpha-6-like [Ostrea edulis]
MEKIRRILLIIAFSIRLCYCEKNLTNSILYDYLLDPSKYNPNIIPICETSDKLIIHVGLALRDIVEVGEKQQFMRFKIWVRLHWKDCLLGWNPSQYQNQTDLTVPSSNVWTPDITLFEGVSDEGNMPNMEDFRADIHYTGTVSYNFPAIVTISCKINVAYFPFDHQICTLTFASWIYTGKFIDLAVKGKNVDIQNFLTHNEWEVVETAAHRHSVLYACCPDPFPDITFYIHMRRKPIFYVVTIIFPCFLINMLTFTGFVLPSFSGEKISLQVTVLLSITVFLLLVQDKLPSSSEHFPCLAIYFANSMALVCVSCVLSSIVLYLYYRSPEDHHISPLIRFIFLDKVRKLLRVKSEKAVNTLNAEYTEMDQCHSQQHGVERRERTKSGNHVILSTSIPMFPREAKSQTHNEHGIAQNPEEWKTFSHVLNRLFMLVYFCLTFGNTSFFVINIIANYEGLKIQVIPEDR